MLCCSMRMLSVLLLNLLHHHPTTLTAVKLIPTPWIPMLAAVSTTLLAPSSGLMVGLRTAFFSFRFRTRPNSGSGRQEGRVKPNKV